MNWEELIPDLVKTLGEIFENSVRHYPNQTALKKAGTEYTYCSLKTAVLRLKDYLLDIGLKPGERFAVIGENRPEWAVSYLAICRAGLVCVPLDPLLGEGEILHILRESGAQGVFTSENQRYKIDAVRHQLKHFQWVISMNDISQLTAAREHPDPVCDPRSLAVLIFTSGTTGTSKAVMLSHENILANIRAALEVIGVRADDRFVSVIPMHHTFEGTVGFLLPLYTGAAVHYPPSLKPVELIATMKEAGVTLMVAVPILFEKLLNGVQRKIKSAPATTKIFFSTLSGISSLLPFLRRPLFTKVRREMGLDRLRIAVSGGAALPERVAYGLSMFGIPIIQGYGLTETAPVLTVNPLEKPKAASVGKPLPGVEIKIHEPDANGIGELIARGPNIMMGYYNNPSATAEIIRDGWLHTGDLGYQDADGYFYITGRQKSLIVTQTGKNIYPEELEEKLIKSPWIKEVLVVPRIEPATRKEEVCALIFPDYEKLEQYSIDRSITLSEAEVQQIFKQEIQKINEELPVYKKITRFEVREEEFPKTTTLKIKRHMFVDRGIKV